MLEEFKVDLKTHTEIQIIRKYILDGDCHALSRDQVLNLKESVSSHFRINYQDVILVGSGKLGFSIKSEKRYQPFGDESDIDLAVVSAELFTKVWEETHLFKKSGADWPKCNIFFKYLSEGWIRPDKLPTSTYFEFTKSWWEFFNNLTASKIFGPYKIRAGLYHSLFFLQEYQKICITQCIEEENNGYLRF